jgi:hypothetical protein
LGERYGWVPEQIPQELVEQEPWLAEHLARSVTEPGIFHGVLRERLVDHYRRIGDLVNLPGSLGNQALILKEKGDLDGAMKLHKEEEHLCRELGNKDGLAISLISQALFLGLSMNKPGEAMSLVDEALRLVTSFGHASLAKQVESIREKIRKRLA